MRLLRAAKKSHGFRGASRQSYRLSRSLTSFTTVAGIVSVPVGHPEALNTVTWTPEGGEIGAFAAAAFLVSPAAALERAAETDEAASAGTVGVTSAPATAVTATHKASRAVAREKKARPRAMATGGSGERWAAREGARRWRRPNVFFRKMVFVDLFFSFSRPSLSLFFSLFSSLHTLEP